MIDTPGSWSTDVAMVASNLSWVSRTEDHWKVRMMKTAMHCVFRRWARRAKRLLMLMPVVVAGCGGGSSSTALLDASNPGVVPPSDHAGRFVTGWPDTIAMGAVGGPNITPPTATSTGGDDDFGGTPIDVVFKYAGMNGNGDPGIVDPPTNAYRMSKDLTALSTINAHPMRVAMVEYTAQMSGGTNLDDFSDSDVPNPGAGAAPAGVTYIMARHFASLGADAQMLAMRPVSFGTASYDGTLIMNPDLLGAIEQNNLIGVVDGALPDGGVTAGARIAACFLLTPRAYTNWSNPNGLSSAPYIGKTYTGTPVAILAQMLDDGYPVWSINSQSDPYWPTSNNNLYTPSSTPAPPADSVIGGWFDRCTASPVSPFPVPDFKSGLAGWVTANNWLVRMAADAANPASRVTLGWQDNMWAAGSGFWLHANLSTQDIASIYSTPVSSFLAANAPDAINRASPTGPDYFVFDRYETDDSAGAAAGTLYNARAWSNYLSAVGQFSGQNNNIPIMLWQIPGSHIPYIGETQPELYNNTPGLYVFSTAPDYFFGDTHLAPDLSNMVAGPASQSYPLNSAVGNYVVCATQPSPYNCLQGNDTYRSYLLEYQGQPANYDWATSNGLAQAAAAHVFAILWGGGNTTNVIKNFSNPSDHGWLAAKIRAYDQAGGVKVQ